MTPERMARISARAFERSARTWSAQDFRQVLDAPGAVLATGEHGFAVGRVAGDEVELLLIATDPDHTRQGLARRCLEGFEAEARSRGAMIVFAEVAADNAPARALYAAAGYAEAGLRRGYYARTDGTRQDALILRKELTP